MLQKHLLIFRGNEKMVQQNQHWSEEELSFVRIKVDIQISRPAQKSFPSLLFHSLHIIGHWMSCDPPVCLACFPPPALQFLTRPPCVIDFSVCLIPWVNMHSLLVHKSHAHTLSPATITKQSTGKLKIWFWQSPHQCFTLHQVYSVGGNHFCLSSSHNIFEKIINAFLL